MRAILHIDNIPWRDVQIPRPVRRITVSLVKPTTSLEQMDPQAPVPTFTLIFEFATRFGPEVLRYELVDVQGAEPKPLTVQIQYEEEPGEGGLH